MSEVPRASAASLEQTARSVNVMRDLLQKHLRAPEAVPEMPCCIDEAEVRELIEQYLRELKISVRNVFPVLQEANAAYGGSQFFYTSHDEGGGYVANRFYIDSSEEAHEDTLTGSGAAPTTPVEFAALAWPQPAP